MMTPRDYQDLIGVIRKTARIQRLFLCSQGKALAVRGSVEQLAAAGALVVERSTPRS